MKKIFVLLLALLVVIGLSSCRLFVSQAPPAQEKPNGQGEPNPEKGPDSQEEPKSDMQDSDSEDTDPNGEVKPSQTESTILYFGNVEAMGLIGEERKLEEISPETLIDELIKGPQEPGNTRTIPQGTKLLGIEIKDNIAYVNFSKEIRDNHWGGSSGESITIFSVVNTLALNPDMNIDKIQLLIDGEEIDSLAGHFIISEPIEPNTEVIK